MPEREGFGGMALGVGLGTLVWNGIFLGFSAIGILNPEATWFCIKAALFGGLIWVALGILDP